MATQIPARRDNLLGICHVTAQTFGFNPILLRVALMLGLLLDFEAAIITYAVMGLAVLAAALLAPTPHTAIAA